MPQLGEIRGQINEIDRQLKPLLMQRMECAAQVAAAKAAQAKLAERPPVIFDGRREDEILNAVSAGAHTDSVKRLIKEVMGTSRRFQYRTLVSDGMLSDPWGDYQPGEAAVIPLAEGKLTDAIQVVSRYQVKLLSADEKQIRICADEILEMNAIRTQLSAEGIAQ